MKCFVQISIAALVLGAVWLGASTHASAQDSARQKVIQSYDQSQTDIREALRMLFREVSVSYSIAPDVRGVVTVSLKNVPFEMALENVLRQVDATFRVEGGVYEIISRRDQTRRIHIGGPDPTDHALVIGAQNEPPATMTADGRYLYVLSGPEIFKFDKDSLKLVKTGSLREIPMVIQPGK